MTKICSLAGGWLEELAAEARRPFLHHVLCEWATVWEPRTRHISFLAPSSRFTKNAGFVWLGNTRVKKSISRFLAANAVSYLEGRENTSGCDMYSVYGGEEQVLQSMLVWTVDSRSWRSGAINGQSVPSMNTFLPREWVISQWTIFFPSFPYTVKSIFSFLPRLFCD